MRVEEIVSSFIMFIVSGLVLVGFTIAWYTNNNLPAVTGMSIVAAEMGDVKVSLTTPDGPDISELIGDAQYADIGMEEFSNFDVEKLAPGTYGKVTFYVTPTSSSVSACEIVPTVRITQDGNTWYPDVSAGDAGVSDGDSSESDSETSGDVSDEGESAGGVSPDDTVTIGQLWDIAQGHIVFFSDKAMEKRITPDEPYIETWALEERLEERTVELYWKWYYEYPFTDAQLEGEEALSDAEQKEYIRDYDEEDRMLGNNISGIKFYFTFSAK